jgi:hypothetical protein
MKKKEILDQVKLLKHRIDGLESDYSQVLVKYAKLESEFEILKQERDYLISHDGDIY